MMFVQGVLAAGWSRVLKYYISIRSNQGFCIWIQVLLAGGECPLCLCILSQNHLPLNKIVYLLFHVSTVQGWWDIPCIHGVGGNQRVGCWLFCQLEVSRTFLFGSWHTCVCCEWAIVVCIFFHWCLQMKIFRWKSFRSNVANFVPLVERILFIMIWTVVMSAALVLVFPG